jgi:hypothetical protein
MSVTGGFNLQAVTTVRIECDLKDPATGEPLYAGLWAEVRRNLTNGERRHLTEAAAEIDARVEALMKAHEAESAAYLDALKAAEGDDDRQRALIDARTSEVLAYAETMTEAGVERFGLIAPHIHRWNLVTIGDAGDVEPVPSPREDAAAALAAITPEIAGWLLNTTLMAYRAGFPIGSRTSGARQEPTPEPSAEKPKTRGSNSRRSRTTSSSRSPSTFEA